MTHKARLELIHKPFHIRYFTRSYPWGGVIVTDNFGESRGGRRSDPHTKYESVYENQLGALFDGQLGLDDAIEVRDFVESQTSNVSKKG